MYSVIDIYLWILSSIDPFLYNQESIHHATYAIPPN